LGTKKRERKLKLTTTMPAGYHEGRPNKDVLASGILDGMYSGLEGALQTWSLAEKDGKVTVAKKEGHKGHHEESQSKKHGESSSKPKASHGGFFSNIFSSQFYITFFAGFALSAAVIGLISLVMRR
jgi:hypothetical protein